MGVRPAVPHLSWTGPGPKDPYESYALAILVRIAETGDRNEGARNPILPPSSFTVKTLRVVACMFAYCRKRFREEEVGDYRKMLGIIKETEKMDMKGWVAENAELVDKATADLLEYVETPANKGFRVYG